MHKTLLILGGSTRAAAFSARRAGLCVECGDLYGDADLRAMCPVTVVKEYPSALAEVARKSMAGPWMFTGGLENHPKLVERLASIRPLLGNMADILRRVRDPMLLSKVFRSAGLKVPNCVESADGLPRDGSWLRKRRKSAGGLHVEVWRGEKLGDDRSRNDESGRYFQQRIEGLCCSATYVADGQRAVLLGATEQLVGAHFGQATEHVPSPFCYAGSIGPLPIGEADREILQRIGDVIAREFKLQGVFGVDFIRRDGDFYPIEVNPRYTASMEIVERQIGSSIVGWHVEACQKGKLPLGSDVTTPVMSAEFGVFRQWYGKAIVYAGRESTVTQEMTARLLAENDGKTWPVVADIPTAGVALAPSHPAATVFGEGSSREEALEKLEQRVRWCREVLRV